MKKTLVDKGVVMPDPASVFIADDVDPRRIFPGAVIHPGCRISGSETCIGPDSRLGAESPVTLRNCQIGKGVEISGGFLEGTTILDGVSVGDGLHARPGTLLEECSSVAHTNGLKQTVLMPYVTLGSLINFCDVLMAGGTDSKNHSEVGSSYIHFNFTPHQDKATASLVGDVPRGVMMDCAPIFLGGQGGLVGPCRIAYGSVVAAGCILRHNVLEENMLITGAGDGAMRTRPYNPTLYGRVDGIIENGLIYLGNILALKAWYGHVRASVMSKTPWGAACWVGAQARLGEIWKERIKRLDQLSEKLADSVAAAGDRKGSVVFAAQMKFIDEWPAIKAKLSALNAESHKPPQQAADVIAKIALQDDYTQAIKGLDAGEKACLTAWLVGVEQRCRCS